MFIAKIAHRMSRFGILLCAAAGSASVSFRPAITYQVGSKPAVVVAGDFNGDGKVDLAVVNAGDSTVNDPGGISILVGNGDGTFQTAKNFNAGNNPGSVVVADFDGDGKDDLVVGRQGNGNNDSGDVTIFISNGDGTFTTGQVITSVLNPSAVAIGDFDSDGKVDLAIFKQTYGSVAIFLGNGNGSFSAFNNYLTPATPMAKKIEVLDFNRDGRKDLAVTGVVGGGSVLIGNGDGTFQTGSSLGSFGTFDSLEFVADFNLDGNVDAILTHCVLGGFPPKLNCSKRAELNDGNGNLSPAPVTAALTNRTTTPGDFDGDGKPDLAGWTSGSLPLAIFAGNGDGSFQSPMTFAGSPGLVAVALGVDLNHDNAPDLVVINIDGTISVILNSGTNFSLSASPIAPGTIGAGQSATSTLNLQLLNLFNNPVSLTCSVQPAKPGAPTCSLSSNSVSFDSSGKAVATLTITAGTLAQLHTRRMELAAILGLPLFGFTFLTATTRPRTGKKHNAVLLFGFTTLLGLVSLSACGGGAASRGGATNYSVTVTGTSAQTQHATTVNVTVK